MEYEIKKVYEVIHSIDKKGSVESVLVTMGAVLAVFKENSSDMAQVIKSQDVIGKVQKR